MPEPYKVPRSNHTGDGVNTSFPFTWWASDEGELRVIITDLDGASSDTTNFTATGFETHDGGTVTYPASGSPLASGYKLTILRTTEISQLNDYDDGNAFSQESIEGMANKDTRILQELNEKLDRTITLPAYRAGDETSAEELINEIDQAVSDSSTYATNAANSATDAANSASDASDSADLAELWAIEDEDVEVETGLYSAYHYAMKAYGYMTAINPASFAAVDMSNVDVADVIGLGIAADDLSNVSQEDIVARGIAEDDLGNVTDVNGNLVFNNETVAKAPIKIHDDAYTLVSQANGHTYHSQHFLAPFFSGNTGISHDIDISGFFGGNASNAVERSCFFQFEYQGSVYGNTATSRVMLYNVSVVNGAFTATLASDHAVGSVTAPSFSMPDASTFRLTIPAGNQAEYRIINAVQGRTQF